MDDDDVFYFTFDDEDEEFVERRSWISPLRRILRFVVLVAVSVCAVAVGLGGIALILPTVITLLGRLNSIVPLRVLAQFLVELAILLLSIGIWWRFRNIYLLYPTERSENQSRLTPDSRIRIVVFVGFSVVIVFILIALLQKAVTFLSLNLPSLLLAEISLILLLINLWRPFSQRLLYRVTLRGGLPQIYWREWKPLPTQLSRAQLSQTLWNKMRPALEILFTVIIVSSLVSLLQRLTIFLSIPALALLAGSTIIILILLWRYRSRRARTTRLEGLNQYLESEWAPGPAEPVQIQARQTLRSRIGSVLGPVIARFIGDDKGEVHDGMVFHHPTQIYHHFHEITGQPYAPAAFDEAITAHVTRLTGPLQRKIFQEIKESEEEGINDWSVEELREYILVLLDETLKKEQPPFTKNERPHIRDRVLAELIGFGPLEILLENNEISEIQILRPHSLHVRLKGQQVLTNVTFVDDWHLKRILDRLLEHGTSGTDLYMLQRMYLRWLNLDEPLSYYRQLESGGSTQFRLPEGHQVLISTPQITGSDHMVVIRKAFRIPLTVQNLIDSGSLSVPAAEFLRAAVIAGVNVVVSGGSATGKTTLINVLSGFIPSDNRLISIERVAELKLRQEHVVRLEARLTANERLKPVTMRDLIVQSLCMQPDCLVVGTVQAEEALDLLHAMNVSGLQVITGVTAASIPDALARLEAMALLDGSIRMVDLVRRRVAKGVHLVIHLEQDTNRVRRIAAISEVLGLQEGRIQVQDIFTTLIVEGTAHLQPTGYRPAIMDRILDAGIHLPPSIFSITADGQ